jgi:hypothetical protein
VRVDPTPFEMKTGSQPTDRQALTGLLTPPGIYFFACAKSCAEAVYFMSYSF